MSSINQNKDYNMNVLSLFDGMSCGQIALERVGFNIENYYASEIDKYSIKVTQHNYPKTIQLGDITKWEAWDIDWSSIDLLIGGSPCQGFSFAGKGLNFEDPRSKLFFVYVDILNHIRKFNPEIKFLLENVRMKKEWLNVISERLNVEPIRINSNLVSAQNRDRYYWCNWEVDEPEDRHITWGDIREYDVSKNFYYSEKGLAWIKRHSEKTGKKLRVWKPEDKCQMIEASHYKNYSAQRFFGIDDVHGLRYITPKECERAQTVPDYYTLVPWKTKFMSNTQRYKMLGNGWTVDVIAHLLQNVHK